MTAKKESLLSYLEADVVNRQIQQELGSMGSPPAISCIQQCVIILVSRSYLVLGCPNSMVKGLIDSIYKKMIQEAVQHILGRPMEVVCRVVVIDKHVEETDPDVPEIPPPWEDEVDISDLPQQQQTWLIRFSQELFGRRES